jgi:hypothetical protein
MEDVMRNKNFVVAVVSFPLLLECVVKLCRWVLAMDRGFTLQRSPARTPWG